MNKFLKISVIFLIIFSWIFSGWPQIWPLGELGVNTTRIPPEIKEAQAAAPTFKSFSAIAASTGADVTVTLGTHAANDIMLIGVIVRDVDDTITWPSGWTQIATVDRGTTARYWWAWKRAASSAETNPLVDKSTATGDTYAAVIIYSGAITTGDPWEVKGTPQTGTADPMVLTGITTLSPSSLVVAAVAGEDNNNAAITTTGTDPAAYTEHYVESTTGADGVVTFSEAARTTAGATGNVSVDWGTAIPIGDGGILLALKPQPTTTLGDGTNPPNKTLAPGAAATSSDIFTFQTDSGTESITNVTTTLAGTGNYAGIAKVEIVDNASTTVYGSVTNPSTDSFSIGLTGLTASTTLQTFQIRITPFSATAMPAPPGALYTVTSTITAWTGANGNTQAGTDSSAATITIDNLSPADVTNATSTPSSGQVIVNWTNPTDTDFSNVIVARATSTANSGTPIEGTSPNVGDALGNGAVIYNSNGTSKTDTGLTNGTTYYYKIWAKDTSGNYSTPGVETSSTPAVASTVSCSTDITSTAFGTLTTSAVGTASPNASTTMSCSGTTLGCTLYIKDNGNGTNGGLWNSTSSYLIPSPNAAFSTTATLSAGTEGYGIQAATTTAGSGGTLNINSIYLQTGNTVGGLTLSNLTLASSSVDISNREIIVSHKAAVSSNTLSGTYNDTITYSCLSN